MAPLNQLDRREGRKAMEASLTAAGRMRRRFKAGRPAKISSDSPTMMDALARVTREIGKAKDLMVDEGLNPDDVEGALILATPAPVEGGKILHIKTLPAPSGMGAFFAMVTDLAARGPIDYLGILWRQTDHEATEKSVLWVTQFMGGPEAEAHLLNAREHIKVGGSRTLDN